MNSISTVCLVLMVEAIKGHQTLANTTEANIKNTSVPVVVTPLSTTTRKPFLQGLRMPCSCFSGQCGCCTGYILDRFNQKACMNLTYEPDDFAISASMSMNGKILYKNSISGKNPPPMCIRVPRFPFVRFCVEFSNIYVANRNIHLCIDAEANWQDFTLLEWSFDCVRMGVSGVAVVSPEDGGGLPGTPVDAVDQTDEDYDDSARRNPHNVGEFRKIIFHPNLNLLREKMVDRSLIITKQLENGDYFISYVGT